MEIQTKFDPFQKVKITAIDAPGTVINIYLKGHNLWYVVDYWLDGLLRSAEVQEDELEAVETLERFNLPPGVYLKKDESMSGTKNITIDPCITCPGRNGCKMGDPCSVKQNYLVKLHETVISEPDKKSPMFTDLEECPSNEQS